MDRDAALDALPAAYARALRLEAAGHDEGEIAARLDLAVDAVATLLEVGRVKLAAMVAADGDGGRDGSGSELGV